MEESQPTSFQIKHLNQSGMTHCCKPSAWLETPGPAGAVVSAEVQTAASGGVNPHRSSESEHGRDAGRTGTSHFTAGSPTHSKRGPVTRKGRISSSCFSSGKRGRNGDFAQEPNSAKNTFVP